MRALGAMLERTGRLKYNDSKKDANAEDIGDNVKSMSTQARLSQYPNSAIAAFTPQDMSQSAPHSDR
jgi:hypothetical protein